jgi:hypothetical protein
VAGHPQGRKGLGASFHSLRRSDRSV